MKSSSISSSRGPWKPEIKAILGSETYWEVRRVSDEHDSVYSYRYYLNSRRKAVKKAKEMCRKANKEWRSQQKNLKNNNTEWHRI